MYLEVKTQPGMYSYSIIFIVVSFIQKRKTVLLSHIYNFLRKAINRLFKPAEKNNMKYRFNYKTYSNIQ